MIYELDFETKSSVMSQSAKFSPLNKRFTAKEDTHSRFKGGIPLVFSSDTQSFAIDSEDTHTLVYGSTGSMKSRSLIMPTIKILGYAGESMIINDSKGELYARCSNELKELGYKIVVCDIREPHRGNAWNPLALPYEFYKQGDLDKATEYVNDIALNLMLDEVSSSADPFWNNSASDLFFGLTLLCFKIAKEFDLPNEAVNIGNIMRMKMHIFNENKNSQMTNLWNYGKDDELISASLTGSVYAPSDTKGGIISTFDQKMRIFNIQPTLLDMLANYDFDMGKIGEEKTAVFLITPDEKTSYHKLVSLFIKQSYEYIIYTATRNEGNRVKNRINYVLDEFSSLPAINDMPAMISAARSRDIRFILVAQSKHQLIKRYHEEAETIISNCTNIIFLASRELVLLKEISELCGVQRSGLPNASVFDLQHLNKSECEAILLSGRFKPLKTNLLDIDRFDMLTDTERTHATVEKGSRNPRILVDYKKLRRVGNPFEGESKWTMSDEEKDTTNDNHQENTKLSISPFEELFGHSDKKSTDKETNLDSFDQAEISRMIDKKIAELEAKERTENEDMKKQANQEGVN